ncbi:MAG: GMC family oxidoreductase [Myxococcota bacterium]|nr:GMC family oxidoreductase [Myxococcota bacterium]
MGPPHRSLPIAEHPAVEPTPEPSRPAATHAPPGTPCLTEAERAALLALGAAAVPAGALVPALGTPALTRLEALLQTMPAAVTAGYRALLAALEASARLRHGRRLAELPPAAILQLCRRWQEGGYARRLALRGLLAPLKMAHFDDPALFQALGCRYRAAPVVGGELPRYVRERTLAAAEVPDGEVLECEVVVVGSGAGGAVAAKELAEAGCAVLLLEEGPYYTRADFTGRPLEMQRKLYRDMGATVAVGNTLIPIPLGRAVGGTTTVNSGTCYRAPARVLKKWRQDYGLTELTDQEMAACYERVEQVLGVAPAQPAYLGGVARVVARGATALGYRHGPLLRNAPDCDGQGVCCFGCPTDAKRSTNVSYVPLALRLGAQLLTGARAEGLLVEGGRVVGVHVRAGPRRFRVRARATVLACGALLTPVLLQQDPVARRALSRSGQLGANLSIHPATAVFALMREQVRGHEAIPQGYAIEEFHDEGLLMEGVFAPLDLAAASLSCVGPRFTALMEAYNRFASFGFLVEEQSRGRVRPGPGHRPLITYWLGEADVARLKQGLDILCRVFLHAGAETVLLQVPGFEEVSSETELRAFRAARLRARDLDLTAYHPLGTARMGPDPRSSVVSSQGQAHDLPGLYVCDGSILPSSPAVNPQLTIMALATRIARGLAARL